MESFRNQDMKAEEKLGEFMDEYFYSRLNSKGSTPLSFKRMKDKESQLNGVDILIEVDGKCMVIDEKASIYYSNAMIPTFAFELDSIQRGRTEPVEGWLINDNLATEYYMLIWPNVKCIKQDKQWIRKDIKKLQKDDFTIVEAFLVPKQGIRMELERRGYDREHLILYAQKMREMCSGKTDMKKETVDDEIEFSYSGQLAEKPVNVVIRKSLLQKLAKGIYLISADGYAVLKGD